MTFLTMLSFIVLLIITLFSLGYIVGNKNILPRTKKTKIFDNSYERLSGTWYLYWLSFIPKCPDPVWLHGICDFQIRGKYALGKVKLINHPAGNVQFIQKGEFRNGKLVLADASVENNDEFATIIYSNIANNDCAVGIWNGFDNLGFPVAAPNIMSRKQLPLETLNRIASQASIKFIIPGDYKSGWDKELV